MGIDEGALASLTPDIFITAGAQGGAPRSKVEDILRRAVDQAAALRGEAA